MIINPSEWDHNTVTPWSDEVRTPKKASYGAGTNTYSLRLGPVITTLRDGVVDRRSYGRVFTLQPLQSAMVSTVEQVDIPFDMCGQLIGKSTWMRLGLMHQVGFVDSGFRGNLSAYVFNAGSAPIDLYTGEGIFQLMLYKTSGAAEYKGNYQNSVGFVVSMKDGNGFDGQSEKIYDGGDFDKDILDERVKPGLSTTLLRDLQRRDWKSGADRHDATFDLGEESN